MNKSSKLLLLIVTVFLLESLIQVECRRTYSSRSSSSGRGNRGKNQPSGGGIFSSWFGGSKSGSSSSGAISKPAPASAKKNWQTASSHATSQSKPSSNWANPYYKPSGSAPLPSAPKQTNYGWKPTGTATNAKPVNSYPTSNTGSRSYPVQSGVQPVPQTGLGGYKPASGVSSTNYQPAQSGFGGYRPASNVPGGHGTGFQPSGHQGTGFQPSGHHGIGFQPSGHQGTGFQPSGHQATGFQSSGHQNNYGGYHSASNYHPPQTSHGYQSGGVPHQPYHQSGAYPQQPNAYSGHHSSYSGYSPHSSFGGAQPTYQGTKLYGGNTGHYGYPGSGSWGIDTYGARKSSSSGTGKLLTGLAVGAAGGYLTSSLVNSISNPWKYSGGGYGSRYGYGSGYDMVRSRDESAFERGYERGAQSRQNENNNNNKESVAPPLPEDPTSKWVQCVAFDPQTQQTLINPNCSCTVTTSLDDRTGQPISVHQCTTLNGLVMRPIPIQPSSGMNLSPPLAPISEQGFGGENQPPPGSVNAPGAVPSYGNAYEGNIQYGGGPTIYLPSQTETKGERMAINSEPEANSKSMTETKTEHKTAEAKPEQSTVDTKSEAATGTVTESQVTTTGKMNAESETEGGKSEIPPVPESLGGGLPGDQKRTSEFYGQLQKIVNMGNFVDGG